MLEAILASRKVRMSYENKRKEYSERTLAPYGISFFEGRWYVIGLDDKSNEIRSFALGRIQDAELTKEAFARPDDFKVTERISLPFALDGSRTQGTAVLAIDDANVQTITMGKGQVSRQDDKTVWTVDYSDLDELSRFVVEHDLVYADQSSKEAKYLAEKLEEVIANHDQSA
jgi:predicted DNA-binding transcriptional regulator YafY